MELTDKEKKSIFWRVVSTDNQMKLLAMGLKLDVDEFKSMLDDPTNAEMFRQSFKEPN